MLTEAQLDELLKIFLERSQSVVEEYLIRMGDQIREIGELIPSSINRLVQLKKMNANLDAVKKETARLAEISVQDLEKIFEAAQETDARFIAKEFGNDFKKSILETPGLRNALEAQYRVTAGEMINLSRTTIAAEGYRSAVDKAIQTVQMGIEDYNSAMRRAISEAGTAGLRVTYPSGRTMRLDSAVRMNVLDGIRSLSNATMMRLGEEFGADGIEISAHRLCAEDHLPYQGQQFSKKAFDDLQSRLSRPFGMWNCKHSMHPILLGISPPAYDEDELEEYRKFSKEKIEIDGISKTRYEWTQEQRRIETAVRGQKDASVLARRAGNAPARRDAQRNINALMDRYDKISEKAGIRTDYGRMRVAGFRAVKPADELKKNQLAVFRTTDDPVREVLGSAYDSHPEEIARIKRELTRFGIKVIEQDENVNKSIGYYPNPVSGKPGQFKINRNASYGAWLHEEQHAMDDKESNWNGIRIAWMKEAIEWERRAYQKEIDLMQNMGYNEIVEKLKQLLDKEIQRRMGGFDFA